MRESIASKENSFYVFHQGSPFLMCKTTFKLPPSLETIHLLKQLCPHKYKKNTYLIRNIYAFITSSNVLALK